MNTQAVSLLIEVNEAWDGSTALQAYTDFGDGSVDFTKPLLTRAVPVWPGFGRAEGYGDDEYGDQPYGDGGAVIPPFIGFGDAEYGDDPYGDGVSLITLVVPIPSGYGDWKFVVRAFDGEGNVQVGGDVTITGFVSGAEPPPVKGFALSSYAAGKATFAFVRGSV